MHDPSIDAELSALVKSFPSLDSAVVLAAVSDADQSRRTLRDVAVATQLPETRVRVVVEELARAGIVVESAMGRELAVAPSRQDLARRLSALYRTRPVTLIRLLYEIDSH